MTGRPKLAPEERARRKADREREKAIAREQAAYVVKTMGAVVGVMLARRRQTQIASLLEACRCAE